MKRPIQKIFPYYLLPVLTFAFGFQLGWGPAHQLTNKVSFASSATTDESEESKSSADGADEESEAVTENDESTSEKAAASKPASSNKPLVMKISLKKTQTEAECDNCDEETKSTITVSSETAEDLEIMKEAINLYIAEKKKPVEDAEDDEITEEDLEEAKPEKLAQHEFCKKLEQGSSERVRCDVRFLELLMERKAGEYTEADFFEFYERTVSKDLDLLLEGGDIEIKEAEKLMVDIQSRFDKTKARRIKVDLSEKLKATFTTEAKALVELATKRTALEQEIKASAQKRQRALLTGNPSYANFLDIQTQLQTQELIKLDSSINNRFTSLRGRYNDTASTFTSSLEKALEAKEYEEVFENPFLTSMTSFMAGYNPYVPESLGYPTSLATIDVLAAHRMNLLGSGRSQQGLAYKSLLDSSSALSNPALQQNLLEQYKIEMATPSSGFSALNLGPSTLNNPAPNTFTQPRSNLAVPTVTPTNMAAPVNSGTTGRMWSF